MFRYAFFILALTLTSIAPVRAEPKLTLVTDNWPPYEFVNNPGDELSGLSTEIVQTLFKRMGYPRPAIFLYPWARAEREVFAGTVDGIYSIAPNSERQRHLFFPDEPLATEQGVIFVQKDRVEKIKIEALADLKQLNIGVVRGYAYTAGLWLALNDFGNFSAVTGEDQLFRMLALGRFDAVISYRNTGVAMARRLGLGDKVEPYEDYVLFTHRFYLAFNRNRVAEGAVVEFSRQLAAFKKTDAYRRLLQKYLPSR